MQYGFNRFNIIQAVALENGWCGHYTCIYMAEIALQAGHYSVKIHVCIRMTVCIVYIGQVNHIKYVDNTHC